MLAPADSTRRKRLAHAMLNIADEMAAMSACDRGQHGCVLADRDMRIVATGYNGPAARLTNHCKRPGEPGNCGCVHAEANACVQPRAREPHFAFITTAPCEACAQLLINVGVRIVVYSGMTPRGEAGLRTLEYAGVGHFPMRDAPGAIFRLTS